MMGAGEIIYEKVYASPRPPPKMSFTDNWRKKLGSEVAGGSNYHVGCAIDLHSIINSGLIAGGQNLSKRRYSLQP